MIENMICMKQLSLLDVILNMLFVLTLILKLTTLDTSSKIPFINKGIEFTDLPSIFLHISKTRNLLLSVTNITNLPVILYLISIN